jgi:hypothetical protein
MEASCNVSRGFTSLNGAITLNIGMPFTFQTGFYVWSSSAVGATVKPIASGTSVPINFTIIEGAASLALTAAAAVIMTLSF